MLTSISLKDKIKAEASRLGFFVCGFARAEPVSEAMRRHYLGWLADGRNADMAYLGNNLDKRFDPRLLMPGVKTIVVVAQNYFPARRLAEGEPQIADYALGLDYHDIVKQKLRQLAATVGIADYRAFVDTAPVLERYWAVRDGMGWIGKNQQRIIPHAGS